jgi:hypothetical protein
MGTNWESTSAPSNTSAATTSASAPGTVDHLDQLDGREHLCTAPSTASAPAPSAVERVGVDGLGTVAAESR